MTSDITRNADAARTSDLARAAAAVALLMTMLIWGSSAVFLRTTALSLSPENALALRFMVLSVVVAIVLTLARAWRVARADWPRLAFAGLAGTFGASWFTIEGFHRVAAGLGSVIAMVEPIVIALFAWVLLREAPARRFWPGVVVALAGAGVLFWPDLTASAAEPVDMRGVIYLVCASVCFAIYAVACKPLLVRYSSLAVTGWTLLIAAVPVIAMASRPLADLVTQTPLRPFAEVIYLAVFNTLIGTTLWNYGARRLPGSVAGSFLYLLPPVGVAAGHLMLDEPITAPLVIGATIMLAGVALAQSGRRGTP
jgi:drug/metabolite transporter (DMT)-like permease